MDRSNIKASAEESASTGLSEIKLREAAKILIGLPDANYQESLITEAKKLSIPPLVLDALIKQIPGESSKNECVTAENSCNFASKPDPIAMSLPESLGNDATSMSTNSDPSSQEPQFEQPLLKVGEFELYLDGVYHISKKGKVRICGNIEVAGLSKDHKTGKWGIKIILEELDGKTLSYCFLRSDLYDQGATVIKQLIDDGFDVVAGYEKHVLAYLSKQKPSKRLVSTDTTGWAEAPTKGLVYVLPDLCIGDEEMDEVVFVPDHASSLGAIKQEGSYTDWLNNIAHLCKGNTYLTFAILVAFVGPLMRPLKMEGFGFHFFGTSSKGKTTLGQCAGSVWGCATDPASGDSCLHRWNFTANGLEGIAVAHNDSLIVLDEIRTFSGNNFDTVVYNLTGGKGKGVMDVTRRLKKQRQWLLVILSTGEYSIRQKIEESGKQVQTGQLVRFIDIPTSDGIITNTHGMPDQQFVEMLKANCGTFYGTPGVAFVQALVKYLNTDPDAIDSLKDRLNSIRNCLVADDMPSEQKRVAMKFAFVQLAGECAAKWINLPFSQQEIETSVKSMFDCWLSGVSTLSDEDRGMQAVKAFIFSNRGRFLESNSQQLNDRMPTTIPGYYDTPNNRYLFDENGIKVALGNNSVDAVLRALRDKGYLYQNDGTRRLKSRHQIGGIGRMYMYAIEGSLLTDDLDESTATSATDATSDA